MAGKGKRFLASVLTMTVMMSVLAVGNAPQSAAASLDELKQTQSDLEKKQEETASQLKQLKDDQAKQQEYVNALNSQMENIEGQIDNLNDQISALDADIQEKSDQISGKQADIDYGFEVLKQRLRTLYLQGDSSNLQILLSSEDMVDFMNKTETMQLIADHDTELINGLRADMEEIAEEKSVIEQNRKDVAAAKKELDQKSLELSNLVEENKEILSTLSANVVEVNSLNNEIAREREEADAAIDQWYAEYYAQQAQSGNSNNAASGGYASTGNFTWPCPGYTYLSSYWGDGRNHKGIDIAGSGIYGKPIIAADSGKVIQAVHSGWGGGYGLCVYIDHGNGYSTRYAHASKVVVNTGDYVEKGQVIAYVGSTGQSTGPHLHFEIRVNGVAQNPMNWFS